MNRYKKLDVMKQKREVSIIQNCILRLNKLMESYSPNVQLKSESRIPCGIETQTDMDVVLYSNCVSGYFEIVTFPIKNLEPRRC